MRIGARRALVIALMVVLWLPAGTQAAAGKTVGLDLIAGKTSANSNLNFNGYAKGAMTITVPVGWTVVVHYKNNTAARHSFVVIDYTGKQPDKGIPPVFKGATTRDPVDGVGAGHEETITFVADRAGKYEFMCGVLGHAFSGMWDFLVVSPTAKAPSEQPRGAASLKTR